MSVNFVTSIIFCLDIIVSTVSSSSSSSSSSSNNLFKVEGKNRYMFYVK